MSNLDPSNLRARVITIAAAIVLGVLLGVGGSLGADAQDKGAPIDWDKARALYQRSQRGETLTPDEQAYLDRAKAERATGNGPRPGGIDMARARDLYQRSQRGEKLSVDDEAYLQHAKDVLSRANGGPARGQQQRPHAPPATQATGLVPLDQMTAEQRYKGEDGGLYGNGSNRPPEVHQRAADRELAQIVPRDRDGKPSASGKIVLISIGMSNATMEFSRFKQLADADPDKSGNVVIVDGAQGGQDAARWSNPDLPAWKFLDKRLADAGVTPAQVQAVWMKHARIAPSTHGEYPAHANELAGHIIKSLNIAREKFPNLRVAYLSSRIYAGYAVTGLNPEPYAYESGLVVRRLIRDQIAGDPKLNYDPAKGGVNSPLLLWGPYLWADGTTPRKSDGLTWKREDLGPDGTHPGNPSGREKVAKLLLEFMKNDPNARGWFVGKQRASGRERRPNDPHGGIR
jgi:hypothetical protein